MPYLWKRSLQGPLWGFASSVEGSWKRLPVWLEENRKQIVAIIVIPEAIARAEQGLGKSSDGRNESRTAY